MLKGFQNFIMKGNVIDLAVAVIMGSAFNTVVNALVKYIVTPFIGAFGGTPDFSGMYFTINKSKFMFGEFLNTLISFVIISAIVYFFIVVPVNKMTARLRKGEHVDPTEKTCPECLSQIPIKATRCKYCTEVVK